MNDTEVEKYMNSLGEDDMTKINRIAELYSEIISLVGEDNSREGLLKTPMRAAKALWFATSGYRNDASRIMKSAIFEYAGSQMIIVRDIEFYSTCEHHVLPFFGHVSIGYVPSDKMVGLSKLARLVNVYARRLQVQERLTQQICQAVMENLDARGVIVRVDAEHLCMKMRGVEKQASATTTVHYEGVFKDDPCLRAEFMSNIGK